MPNLLTVDHSRRINLTRFGFEPGTRVVVRGNDLKLALCADEEGILIDSAGRARVPAALVEPGEVLEVVEHRRSDALVLELFRGEQTWTRKA